MNDELAKAIGALKALTMGQKGGRPDYVGMVSGQDASLVLSELSRQREEIEQLRADMPLLAGICCRLREAAHEFDLRTDEKLDVPVVDALRLARSLLVEKEEETGKLKRAVMNLAVFADAARRTPSPTDATPTGDTDGSD
jgi:hypothetical protein